MNLEQQLKINKKVLIPPIIALTSFLLSPEFYGVLPDRYAHLIAMIAGLVSVLSPSLIHKKKDVKESTEVGREETPVEKMVNIKKVGLDRIKDNETKRDMLTDDTIDEEED